LLSLKNLRRRKIRTGLTALGVAIGVAIIVALISVAQGLQSQFDQLFAAGDAHLVVTRKGAADPFISYLPDTLLLHNLVPTLTAAENVELPLYALRVRAKERRTRANARLEAVGLAHRADHLPDELSGGERQRVAIARALVNDPKLILADEPTGDLDQNTGRQIIELLRRLQSERELTLILVTHHPRIAATAHRVVGMLDGRLTEDAQVDDAW